MLKKLICLLLCFSTLLSLFSCGAGNTDGEGDPPDGGGTNENPPDDDKNNGQTATDPYVDYLFAEGVMPKILAVETRAIRLSSALYSGLKEHFGKIPAFLQSDRTQSKGHEIVVGETSREISAEAYAELAKVEKVVSTDVAYVIYSKGSSIAIAYEEKYSALALELAITDLLENVIADKTELKLEDGVVIATTKSALAHYEKLDKEYRDGAWAALADYLGEDNAALTNALSNYYDVYDPKLVVWLANLYAPEIGGFYYSNSGRDSVGFAPDIESTAQALSFIPRSGMSYLHGGYNTVIPADILDDIGMYVKSLQAPDGYFYNYQWTKESHTSSRLSRDLSSASGILDYCGKNPTYDTPLGEKGDGIVVPLPEAAAPVSLRDSSTTVAVSRAILAASIPEIIESTETLRTYLEGMKTNIGKYRWYGIGSNVNSMMKQIKTRDNVLKTEFFKNPENNGKTYFGLVDTVIEFFNENQNPETGHWETASNYLAVNGILKITGVYAAAGAEMKYAEKLVKAAFDAVTSDEEMTGVVDVYNAWSAVGGVVNNIREHGASVEIDGETVDAETRADRLLEMVREDAVRAVNATAEKLLEFRKEDGSFSYTPMYSSASSQGMAVAKPRSVEGDVNATELAVNATLRAMFNCLGLSDYFINVFGAHELVVFLNIIENAQPVVKTQ